MKKNCRFCFSGDVFVDDANSGSNFLEVKYQCNKCGKFWWVEV